MSQTHPAEPLRKPLQNPPQLFPTQYYECPVEDLRREALRRALGLPLLPHNELSEALQCDDELRGSEATTVETQIEGAMVPRQLPLSHTAEFGTTVPATQLVNQKIVYWILNTFFPTLQLFFESGLSCTIDGSELPDARIGLDPALHFKLTDCAHEEDGRVTKAILPRRYHNAGTGLVVREVTVAQRSSIALKPIHPADTRRWTKLDCPRARIVTETHTVVGMRLSGMDRMAYIWSRARTLSAARVWGNVRIAGLQNDVPIPNVWSPEHGSEPGAQSTVVFKGSLIAHSGDEK